MRNAMALVALSFALQMGMPVHADGAASSGKVREYAAARDAIVHHSDGLMLTVAQQGRPQETLQGVIEVVDERGDRLSLQVDGASETDFAVRDGLIFNAIHPGDRVEVTVENIEGKKTIVGLKKL